MDYHDIQWTVCYAQLLFCFLGTYVPAALEFPQTNGGDKGCKTVGFGFSNPYEHVHQHGPYDQGHGQGPVGHAAHVGHMGEHMQHIH